mgnify:CR=1 FL=1
MIQRRQWIVSGGAIVLSLGAHDIAFGAAIVAVRVWPATDYTRVTIEKLAQVHATTHPGARLTPDDGAHATTREELLAGLGPWPAYYAHMAPANAAGPAAPDLSLPSVADAAEPVPVQPDAISSGPVQPSLWDQAP